MTSRAIPSLEKLIGTPRDGALLRYSLGNEYLKAGDAARATEQLREAVARDPGDGIPEVRVIGATANAPGTLREPAAGGPDRP